jgi:predicted nucleic acid-binding protein
MKERSFIDTNVLIYADDRKDLKKQKGAIELLQSGWCSGNMVLSTQVLQEYFSAATRKLKIEAEIAQRKIELLSNLEIAVIDQKDMIHAIEIHRLYSLSFWDALIVKMAQKTACVVLYSEEMQHGQRFGGVRIVNPFIEMESVSK